MTDTPTKVISFGSASNLYTFPTVQGTLSDNFNDLVTRTSRMPGVSGGYDAYGTMPAPGEVGNVRFDFTLVAISRGAMQTLRDAVNAMKRWGVQRLLVQFGDLGNRWAYARISSIQMTKQLGENTDLFQPVSVNFQVADPYWYSLATETWLWGDGTEWGAASWASIPTTTLSSLTNTFTTTISGVFETFPRMLITTGAGVSFTDVTIERIVGGVTVDRVAYTGAVNQNSTLQINARALAVLLNGADAYTSAFTWLLPSWFRLEPGANSMKITFTSKTGNPTYKVQYYERW